MIDFVKPTKSIYTSNIQQNRNMADWLIIGSKLKPTETNDKMPAHNMRFGKIGG